MLMEEEVKKKKKHPFKIFLKVIAIWFGCAIIFTGVYFGIFAKAKLAYNGIEYNGLEAYVYIEIDNRSTDQIKFDRTNFSIKGNNVSKTANALYTMYSGTDRYGYQSGEYILNSFDKVKIMLVFYRTDITTDCSIYYNGELISKL